MEWAAGPAASRRPNDLGAMQWAVRDLGDQALRPCNLSCGAIKVASKGYSSLRDSQGPGRESGPLMQHSGDHSLPPTC